MQPEDIGISRTELVLGKHSGRHALRERISSLGYELSDEELNRVFDEFKRLCDLKKEVFDADLEALVTQRIGSSSTQKAWELVHVVAQAGNACKPSCSLTLKDVNGKEHRHAEFGGGPVDAMYHALCQLTGVHFRVTDYQIHSVTVGNDALGEVTVQVDHDGHTFRSRAVSMDIVTATAKAFVHVLNRLQSIESQRHDNFTTAQATR
jgi:2-isopropylmalate synthase